MKIIREGLIVTVKNDKGVTVSKTNSRNLLHFESQLKNRAHIEKSKKVYDRKKFKRNDYRCEF